MIQSAWKVKLLVGALGLAFAAGASAQTPQDAIQVSANPGDPSWGTFVFGHTQNGQPGETELIVQCDMHRAWLITDFDAYGLQLVSNFFTVSCTQSTGFVNGKRQFKFTVYPTPLVNTLTMTGRDAGGNVVTDYLTLTLTSANWTVLGGGRWETTSGSAGIAY